MTSDWPENELQEDDFHLPPLPEPADRNIALGVHRGAQRALRQGHPWIYAQAIERQSHEGQPGDLAVIFDHRRRFLAIGLYDPTSAIRVRVLHHGQSTPINLDWFRQMIAAALVRRAPLQDDPRTSGYRLIHGENDGMPGLVLDRYDNTCVLKLYTVAWIPYLAQLAPVLVAMSDAKRLVLRMSRAVADQDAFLYGLEPGQTLYGPPPDAPVEFMENGLRFAADVVHGQKTGFFFDHRHNRARVESLARDRDVLNLFAYSGAFSLYAARGGARRVVSQDLSGPALAAAQENFTRNRDDARIAAPEHDLLEGDAFEALRALRGGGKIARQTFDLIVVDPPSFAASMDDVPRALQAYERLARGALRLLNPGGLLIMASCTARVTPEQFYRTILGSAGAEGFALEVIARSGHALDHPVGFAEGRYLKCLFARLVDGP